MNAIDMDGIVSSPETPKGAKAMKKMAVRELGVKGTAGKGGKHGSGSSSSKSSSPCTSPKSPKSPKTPNYKKVMKSIMKKSSTPTPTKSVMKVMKAMKCLTISKKRPAARGNHDADDDVPVPNEMIFNDAMCEARMEYDDMVVYNKSFHCPPPCTWRACPGSKLHLLYGMIILLETRMKMCILLSYIISYNIYLYIYIIHPYICYIHTDIHETCLHTGTSLYYILYYILFS